LSCCKYYNLFIQAGFFFSNNVKKLISKNKRQIKQNGILSIKRKAENLNKTPPKRKIKWNNDQSSVPKSPAFYLHTYMKWKALTKQTYKKLPIHFHSYIELYLLLPFYVYWNIFKENWFICSCFHQHKPNKEMLMIHNILSWFDVNLHKDNDQTIEPPKKHITNLIPNLLKQLLILCRRPLLFYKAKKQQLLVPFSFCFQWFQNFRTKPPLSESENKKGCFLFPNPHPTTNEKSYLFSNLLDTTSNLLCLLFVLFI